MIRLPRGKAVKTDIDLGQVDISTALKTLRQGRFTGYLSFEFAAGEAIFLFEDGRLSEALYKDDHCRLTSGLGLERALQVVREQGGRLNIYRVNELLAELLVVVLGGIFLLQEESLAKLNIQAVLARMAQEKRSGCMRIYSEQRVALIFYEDGHPIGFFHEGCTELTKEADLSLSVARDEGARLDVLVPTERLLSETTDLLADAF